MASVLKCSICPKQPTFTDTSHLLTHVGSKAHLAVLHKLQIKSHDDVAASFELTAYNQWYYQHGLAQLLSERMQSKERKKADKQLSTRKKRGTRRAKSFATSSSPVRQVRRGRGRPKKVKLTADANSLDVSRYALPCHLAPVLSCVQLSRHRPVSSHAPQARHLAPGPKLTSFSWSSSARPDSRFDSSC
jgi:hypothetical protein